MNRILVIGSAGSGKSTLSQELNKATNLPIIHLDRYYWKPSWVPTPNEEWDHFVEEAAKQERWIIDGNYSRTIDLRLKRADTVIFLDMPRILCIYRIIKRRIKYHGKTRPDLNEECPEKLDWAFFVWVWNYKKRSRPKIIKALETVKDQKQVIILSTRKQVNEFIDRMKSKGKF
ncbi:DNA topology modulation protein [Cohnella pontilimi]|uniref:DNA topology modulation protein n=1 Tax=Cohnella pontilimi TaxID=2564100 RepID=A0A4U0FG37_9BACL|nr:DNA topology modulation protein [Cohnella pontilimi]TJY43851.1 DNA topology modulation protein [Cohnella pontilimi]